MCAPYIREMFREMACFMGYKNPVSGLLESAPVTFQKRFSERKGVPLRGGIKSAACSAARTLGGNWGGAPARGPLSPRLRSAALAASPPACWCPALWAGVLRSQLPARAAWPGGRAVVGRSAPSFEMGMGGKAPPAQSASPRGILNKMAFLLSIPPLL